MADLLEAVHRDSGIDLAGLRGDGGAAANDALVDAGAVPLRPPAVPSGGHPGNLAVRRPPPGYHELVDTVDRIDFDKMAGTVRLTVDAVRALASTAAPPRFRYPDPDAR